MWNEIINNDDVMCFMNRICFFHDSCIKELKYVSGAYVNKELSMYPINSCRKVRIIVQRQFVELSTIEMEFDGLKYLKLSPVSEGYTCEILDATIILKKDCVFWCDSGNLREEDLANYEGTIICAEKLRWRSIDKPMGQDEIYISCI